MSCCSPATFCRNVSTATSFGRASAENGVVVLSCFISPYKRMRDNARAEIGDFLEIYVHTPMDTLIERDVKGMYK